jgi:hypothetical protein
MEYDKGQDSFLTFLQGKVKISEGVEVQPFKQSMSLYDAMSTMRFEEHTRVSAYK